MFKKLLAGTALAVMASSASAAFVVTEDIVTGDETAGLEVTATFSDGSSESLTFMTISSVPDTGPNIVVQQEGLVGGATGSSFDIQQQGNSLGNTDGGTPPTVYGLWTVNNLSSVDLIQLVIDGTSALLAFDNIFDTEETPGSDLGRFYTPDPAGTVIGAASYSNQVSPMWDDLFFTMTIDFEPTEFGAGETLSYLADVDQLATPVPAPAGLAVLGLGLLALARRARA